MQCLCRRRDKDKAVSYADLAYQGKCTAHESPENAMPHKPAQDKTQKLRQDWVSVQVRVVLQGESASAAFPNY